MNRRESYISISQPPMLQSPPPMHSPMSNRSYRWTSMTAANSDKIGFDQKDSSTANTETPDKRKADTSWLSPTRGDTWRLNAPRGRTRDLAAAFDRVAKQDILEFNNFDMPFRRRIRRNSEPNYENENKEVVETNFIDDSMLEEHEEEDRAVDLDNDYFDRQTMVMRGELEQRSMSSLNGKEMLRNANNGRENRESVSSHVHRSTIQHVINENGDTGIFSPVRQPIVDLTPRRPTPTGTRTAVPSLNFDKEIRQSNESMQQLVTSTPYNAQTTEELGKYFPQEESIRASPMSRRGRRGTQVISIPPPPSFDSPKEEKKFKIPTLPAKKQNASSVKSIAHEFEKADFGFHRKIDPASEIAELRRQAASSDKSRNEENSFDQNQNVINSSQESLPRVSHKNMKPSIQMGVNGYRRRTYEIEETIGEDTVWSEHRKESQEDLYSLPVKSSKEQAESKSPRIPKPTRQSLPFSDIPEERTYDKIDEMFDFAEKTGDFGDKTLERTGGYAEILSKPTSAQKFSPQGLETPKKMDMSTATYQDIDFDRTEQFENDDGSKHVSSTSGPQFTRSPTLVTPHAGQSVTEYRVSGQEGRATTEKIVVNRALQPAALATSTPKGTLATRNAYNNPEDSFVSSISNMSTADKINDSRKQISKLIELIEKTRKHIQLAEIALIDAKKSRMIVQELSAQRVLLVCRERLKLQLDEVRRLQALSVVRHPPPPLNRHFKSSMVISNIAIHLNKNFNCRGSFAFIVALKCRTEIEATGVVTLMAHYQTRLNVIHFGEHLHFSNLPVDFVVTMEVYMMRVPEYKPPEKTCVSVFASKCRNLLVPNGAHRRPKLKAGDRTLMSLPGGYQSPDCEFKFCGKLTLDRDSAGDRHFYLDDIVYPLEGTVKLVSHCSSLPEAIDVEYSGFLYMYDEKSPNGEPAWERYWAMLNRGVVFFWRSPEDERSEQIPLSQIDLTKCTNQSIEEMRKGKNGQHHMFQIEILIDQTPSVLERRRVLLAAESAENVNCWLNALNDTLLVLRS